MNETAAQTFLHGQEEGGVPKAQSSSWPARSLLQAQLTWELPNIPTPGPRRDPGLSTQPQKYRYKNQKYRQGQQEKHVATSQAALGRLVLQGYPNPTQPLLQRRFSMLLFSSCAAQKHNPSCMSIPAPGEITRRQHGKESFPPKNPARVSPDSSPPQLAVSSEFKAVIQETVIIAL